MAGMGLEEDENGAEICVGRQAELLDGEGSFREGGAAAAGWAQMSHGKAESIKARRAESESSYCTCWTSK
jgi:hypothetical protein